MELEKRRLDKQMWPDTHSVQTCDTREVMSWWLVGLLIADKEQARRDGVQEGRTNRKDNQTQPTLQSSKKKDRK